MRQFERIDALRDFATPLTNELALYVGLTLVFYLWLRTRSKTLLAPSPARSALPTAETPHHGHAA